MISAPVVGGWIAHAGFFVLIAADAASNRRLTRTAIFALLWLAGFFRLPLVSYVIAGDSRLRWPRACQRGGPVPALPSSNPEQFVQGAPVLHVPDVSAT